MITAPIYGIKSIQVEGIALDEDSLSYLGEIGEETSLRHAVQVRSTVGIRQYMRCALLD